MEILLERNNPSFLSMHTPLFNIYRDILTVQEADKQAEKLCLLYIRSEKLKLFILLPSTITEEEEESDFKKQPMKEWMWIALGEGIGSTLRYLTTSLLSRYGWGSFPLGTFTVNLLGCFFMGILFGLSTKFTPPHPIWRAFFQVGICGGYTTFSAFSLDNLKLLESEQYGIATLYATGSLVIGLLAVWLGYALTRQMG